jgi:3-ketoacyl-CoA synthase
VVVPDLRTAVDHFAIHAGGRAVIDAVQEALGLSEADVASSRTVLREMGNVSSASVWYEVQDIEATRRPRRGDTVCLLAFGSGMKFNSLVMRKL